MNNRIVAALSCTLAVLALPSAHAAQVIKLATMSPLSGSQSDQGLQIRNAAALAVQDFVPLFAQKGLTLQLAPYDDQSDPATGTSHARRMVADKSIVAVIGTYNSGVAIPVSAVMQPSHLAMITPAASSVGVTARGLPNMNRVIARDDAQGSATGKFIVESLKPKSIYFLNDKTAYGEGLAGEVEKYVRTSKIQVVGSEGTEEKSDFSSIVNKIKVTKPDLIYFGSIFNQGATFVRQLREAGVTTPVMGGDGWDSAAFVTIAGKAANGVLYTATAAPPETLPASAKLRARYQQAYKSNIQGFGMTAYDAATVALRSMLASVKTPGQLPARQDIETAIRKGHFVGLLSGDLRFNAVGDKINPKIYVLNFADGGKVNIREAVTVNVK